MAIDKRLRVLSDSGSIPAALNLVLVGFYTADNLVQFSAIVAANAASAGAWILVGRQFLTIRSADSCMTYSPPAVELIFFAAGCWRFVFGQRLSL